MASLVRWIAKPFCSVQTCLLLGLRAAALAVVAWGQFLKLTINFHVDLCWQILVLGITLMILPIRLLTALRNEVEMRKLLSRMQAQVEKLVWEKEELEERLRIDSEEKELQEMMLKEMEEEHERVLSRIDLLENQLQELKEENMRLTEVDGKTRSANKVSQIRSDKEVRFREALPRGTEYTRDPWQIGEKGEALRHRRVIALARSSFSAFLSLLVGMVIWEADDPCLPLVAALFIVVGISLGSVLDFFSTIRNKPALDAVALLSINWFMLGTLSSPALPVIARTFAPSFARCADWLGRWLGLISG